MKYKNTPATSASVKAGPDDGLDEGEFLVYPSTFIRKPDSYGDVIAPGAFAKTIKEWVKSGNTLPGLYGHRFDDPDYFVASAIDMGEDEHGWWVKGAFDMESPKGRQVYRLVKGRRLNQLSFAFDALDEGRVTLEDGTKANELRELKVYEFSFVPIGANQDTSVVAVKAAVDLVDAEIKAGRTLSAKNESEIRSAHQALARVLSGFDSSDEEKASGTPSLAARPDASGPAATEANPSVSASRLLDALALEIELSA